MDYFNQIAIGRALFTFVGQLAVLLETFELKLTFYSKEQKKSILGLLPITLRSRLTHTKFFL